MGALPGSAGDWEMVSINPRLEPLLFAGQMWYNAYSLGDESLGISARSGQAHCRVYRCPIIVSR